MKPPSPARSTLYLGLSLAITSGCALQQEGKIYSMTDGRTASVTIEGILSSSGTLYGSLPTGQRCLGRFERLRKGAGDAARMASGVRGDADTSDAATLDCGGGETLACGLVRRPNEEFTHGSCVDQRGQRYGLLFYE